jgi:aminoglycoside phosphotransferase (APT) family kinase protein
MSELSALRRNPTDAWLNELRARYPTERSVDVALTRRMRKRSQEISYSSPSLEEVGARLKKFIAQETNGAAIIRNLRRLTGGASKEQFVFDLEWDKGKNERTNEKMVLRCEPAASIVETSRRGEFELMQFGARWMPVPPVYWMDEDGSTLGAPSLIAGFVEGVQKPAKIQSNVTGMGIHFPSDYRQSLAPEYIDLMVRLHKAPIADDALPSFARPSVGTTEASELIVNWWARIWAEDLYEEVPIAILTESWLRANLPVLDHLSVVHGDLRTGNFLFDETKRQITAVLDWELGYLGDRHGDLGWILTDLYITREAGSPFYCGLFPSENELIEGYEAAGGLPLNKQTLYWHKVFCTWKQLVLSLGCALRAAEDRSHQDVLLTWVSACGYTISEALRRLLENA